MRPLLPSLVVGGALALVAVVLLAPSPAQEPPTAPPPAGESPVIPPAGQPPTQAPEPEPTPAGPPAEDRLAGLLTREVPAAGTGELVPVPGADPAPDPAAGEAHPVRVEVEDGVPVDPQAFAAFVMSTLNDPRGWGPTFVRTDGSAPLQVVLASPATVDRLCQPLTTRGLLSCRNGERAVITHHRWVNGTDEYADDLTAYRRYVVGHEVGHWLGHGHVPCPAPGAPAPVMAQQTFGLEGCVQNPWPNP